MLTRERDDRCHNETNTVPLFWGNIGSNERQGDRLREYMMLGWGVMWHMANISEILWNKRDIDLNSEGCLAEVKCLEREISAQQCKFVSDLTEKEMAGYAMVDNYTISVFEGRVIETASGNAASGPTGCLDYDTYKSHSGRDERFKQLWNGD